MVVPVGLVAGVRDDGLRCAGNGCGAGSPRRYDVAPQKGQACGRVVQQHCPGRRLGGLRASGGAGGADPPGGSSAVEVAWHHWLRQQGVYVRAVEANVDGEFATLVPDGRTEHGSRTCASCRTVRTPASDVCADGRLPPVRAVGSAQAWLAHLAMRDTPIAA